MTALASHILVRPQDVLPPPDAPFDGPIAVDTETSGLYVDEGHRICAVSISYYLIGDPKRYDFAFPFDQGRPDEKGFEVRRLRSGMPKGYDPDCGMTVDEWLEDWTADYNLGRTEWDFLMDWLEETGRRKGHTYQNASFDLLMFDAGTRVRDRGDGGGYPGRWLEPFVVWDTMLASKNIWPQHLTGLKPTGERLYGAERVADAAELKDALLTCKKVYGLTASDGPRYDLVPWRINGKYAASDTSLTKDIERDQTLMLEDGYGAGWAAFRREMNLMRVLTRMSRRGFGPYSVAESHEWANAIAARIAELEPRLPFVRYGALPSETDPAQIGQFVSSSSARASEYYFEVLGREPWKVNETRRGYEVKRKGQAARFVRANKADKFDVARRFPDYPEITFKQGELTATIADRMGEVEYAEFLRLKIANQMFYRNYAELAGPDGKLRTAYRQAHVKSGRMSVERFQAQALPKKLGLVVRGEWKVPEPRAFFHVPEGRVRYNLDLSQAELRIGSHTVGAKAMYEVLDAGADLHGETCKNLFHIDEDHPDWKPKRDISKRSNFGLIFNMGATTFRGQLWDQAQLEMSLAELREIVNGWRALYPEFGQAWHYWHDYAIAHDHVVLWNGERSWFTKLDYPNTALNRVIQGGLAVWVAEWLTLVEQMTEKYDAMVLSVHDSAVLDLPEDTAEDTVARVRELSQELWYDRLGYPGKVDADTWTYHEGVDLYVPADLAARYIDCNDEPRPTLKQAPKDSLAHLLFQAAAK